MRRTILGGASLVALLFVLALAGCGAGRKLTASTTKGRTSHATLHVYFCTDQTCAAYATQAQIDRVRSTLASNPLVNSVKFVSKEDAFKEMQRTNPGLTKKVKKNPLPDALVVTASPGDAGVIAASLKPYPRGSRTSATANAEFTCASLSGLLLPVRYPPAGSGADLDNTSQQKTRRFQRVSVALFRTRTGDPLLTIERRDGNRGHSREAAGTKAAQEEGIAGRRVTACARSWPRWCSLRVPSVARDLSS